MYLRTRMKEVGITSAELAAKVDVRERTIKAYERGERQPSVKVAKRLAAVLEIDWTRFFDDTEDDAHAHDDSP